MIHAPGPASPAPCPDAAVGLAESCLLAALVAADCDGHPDGQSSWAVRMVAALAALGQTRHLMAFGDGGDLREFAALAAQGHGAISCSLVHHDPDLLRVSLADDFLPFVRSRWCSFSVAPLVLRRWRGNLLPVYREAEIVTAVTGPADVIVISGPPATLGGRRGAIVQALRFSRPGTILLLPARSREDRLALASFLDRQPDLVITIDRFGIPAHCETPGIAAIARSIIPPNSLSTPDAAPGASIP